MTETPSITCPTKSQFANRKREVNKTERSVLWLKLRNIIIEINADIHSGRISQDEKKASIERLIQMMATVTRV